MGSAHNGERLRGTAEAETLVCWADKAHLGGLLSSPRRSANLSGGMMVIQEAGKSKGSITHNIDSWPGRTRVASASTQRQHQSAAP
jgi:hypothetical protein